MAAMLPGIGSGPIGMAAILPGIGSGPIGMAAMLPGIGSGPIGMAAILPGIGSGPIGIALAVVAKPRIALKTIAETFIFGPMRFTPCIRKNEYAEQDYPKRCNNATTKVLSSKFFFRRGNQFDFRGANRRFSAVSGDPNHTKLVAE